jgi:WD40 repeat protein
MSDGHKNEYKYWAFISYSHQDRAWGDWLHKTLETYRVPGRLIGRSSRDGQVPARLFPVFRDRDELPSSANLGDVLNESLRQSRYQIVICSPRSAASRWVNEEIKYFKSLGREDRVLCLIVDGEPNVFDLPGRDIEECFAPALRYRVDTQGQITDIPAEPIAADAREHADGKRGAKLKLLSGLLGVGLDELVQRERQREFWKRVQISAAAMAFAGLCVGAWQWFQNERAAREREIVIERLLEKGRLEMLNDQHARAATFLNQAYQMGESSIPVRFMLAQAMRPLESLGETRVQHDGVAVYKSGFSPDGRRFVLHVLTKGEGQQEAVARVYEAATGKELWTLSGAPAFPTQLEFLENSRLLMSGYPDDNRSGAAFTRIWSQGQSGPPVTVEGSNGIGGRAVHPDGSHFLVASREGVMRHRSDTAEVDAHWLVGVAVTSTSFGDDGRLVAAATDSGEVLVLDALTGQILKRLRGGQVQPIGMVAFTANNARLLSMSPRGGDIRVWDLESGDLRLAFSADSSHVNQIHLDQRGARLVSVGQEGYKVWSLLRGSLLLAIPRSLNPYSTATLSPDGNTLVTADFLESVAEVWDVPAGRILYRLDLHSDGVSSVVFDGSGRRLLLSSRDGTAGIWNFPARPAWRYDSFVTLPRTVRFDASGSKLLAGGGYADGKALLFDSHSKQIVREFGGHRAGLMSAEFSPSGQHIATASLDGTAGLWASDTGERIATLEHDPTGLQRATFSPDGSRLALTSAQEQLRERDSVTVWDIPEGRLVARLPHEQTVLASSFTPDSKLLATGGLSPIIQLWRTVDGTPAGKLSGHSVRVRSLRFDATGDRLLSAADDGTVRIWDIRTLGLSRIWTEPALGNTMDAVWSPDEKQVAVATQQGVIWVWTPETNQSLTLKGHTAQVQGLRYSSNGTLLFSHSYDGSVRAWDPHKGLELGTLTRHNIAIEHIDVSPDGQWLAAAAWGHLSLTDIAPETRSPRDIAAVLRCKSPWRVNLETTELRREKPAETCESAE